MTTHDLLGLFVVMIALAAIPSASVALVVVRSATVNVRNGIATAIGVVTGDLIFIAMVMMGLVALSEIMGAFFAMVRYLAAGYLLWLGCQLIRHAAEIRPVDADQAKGSVATSFISGLALTLGDIKAILFYASFFPAFVDIASLTKSEVWLIMLVTVVAVGGVKVVYALVANRMAYLPKGVVFQRKTKVIAGGLLVGAGGYLIVKA
ncbi:LysE family translocator [Kineobactrum salinum]|uniref:LysE family translocator n=1 Tax=Kineobactrum salinum TaxID=2708301 RepID=A0A6C0U1W9_9GAMM|nr:LysE family translocator [Kineobactrum salinum]QIB66120.1 LysE family translocator [Kineobactrum salinum]